MATAPFSISDTTPGDSDIVSQFPSNERTNRDVIASWLAVDHDATTGHHNFALLVDQTTDPTFDDNQFGIYQVANDLRVRLGGGTVRKAIVLAEDVKALWPQAAVPDGWTLDTTWNDKLLRVNSATGAGTGGSWTISGISVNNHTLVLSEIPAHNHSITGGYKDVPGDGGTLAYVASTKEGTSGSNFTIADAGGGGGHSHTLTIGSSWRPAYADVVVGTKN